MRKKGQAMTEYIILIALIAIASIGVVQVLGRNIRTKIHVVSEALRGEKAQDRGIKASDEQIQVNHLGNFQRGLEKNDR